MRDRIHAQILAGRYEPGDKLPRDADIAEDLNCARATVQRAMQDLSDSGLIERRRKGGTHVRRDPVARATLDIPLTRREIEEAGGTYGYRLISRTQRAAPRAIRQRMGLSEAARLLRVEALHLSDGRPFLLEDRWVNPEVAPEILEVDLDVISANEWLVLNKPYTRFGLEITAEAADARTAGHLGIGDGTAILVVERTTWIDDSPITSVRAMMAPGYRLLAET
ncbi:GntR family transcriptional regulator [Ovoidimarina sediminis]|uniref:GntR family transcriptional regulator n=1 Tax=Ovoidimarina sediminis TaxID=3079856 RepID=UPI002910EA30|nr:GntR family transcriptional regulator [Rhodophyticola sp. MJ-SS7]MDU8944247.1 GntR family transcriptional regulator [Rhodophyticola sp. MJ-SS7]